MKSIKLINNDIAFDTLGRMVLIEGPERIRQSIEKKFQVYKGDLFYADEYGTLIFQGKMTQDDVERIIKETVLDGIDVRIADIEFVNHYKVNGQNHVDAVIHLEDEENIEYSFLIGGNYGI